MSNIKKELVSGVFYIAIAKYSGLIVQLFISAILARLLSPSDFGIVAIATVIIAFFNIISDIGIGPAIIQNKDLTNDDLNHIFSLTGYIGSFLAILFFLLSWPIASYYNNDVLVSVCQWLSLSILFQGLNIVPINLQYKNKNFKFIASTTLIVQIAIGIISVTSAYCGMGLYALVLSQVASSIVLFLIYFKKSLLQFKIKPQFLSFKKIMSFSIYQFLFNLINYFSRNLDKLLIGRFIGMSPLGYYEKSYRLMLLPLQNITFVITPVMQPVLSNLQDNLQELAEKYIKILQLLAYISFPLSVFLYFNSEELILLFFGDQWKASVEVFKILSLTVSLQILMSTSGSIFMCANATKQLFISGCWSAIFMVMSFAITIGVWHTIESVAYGFLIAILANTIQSFYLLFKTLYYPIKEMLVSIYKPFVIGLLLFIILYVYRNFIIIDNLLLSLIIKSSISFIITYFLVLYWGKINLFRIMKQI